MTTLRTSRKDQNYYSVTPEGCTFYAGTDHPEPAPAPEPDGGVWAPNDHDYDAIFKTSRVTGLHLTNMTVEQGRENALDSNAKCTDCSFSGEFGAGGGVGDQIITTKGGCQRMTYAGTIRSDGRNATVVVGAWSDQSYDKSTDLDYSGLTRADGRPITFILARCERVKLPPGAKVLRFKSWQYEIYWNLKWVAVKLGLFR